jgi:hypothetical protein
MYPLWPNQTNGSKDNWGRTFFCIWEGENEWGEIYTSLLATQVRFAHLLRSQGDKINIFVNHLYLLSTIKHQYSPINWHLDVANNEEGQQIQLKYFLLAVTIKAFFWNK